jgi:hypothetical protein
MAVGPINPFAIETEAEVDEFLSELFQKPEYRSLDEAVKRAQKFVTDDQLKAYLIEQARQLLNN